MEIYLIIVVKNSTNLKYEEIAEMKADIKIISDYIITRKM